MDWKTRGIELHHGDCRDWLDSITADAVVTDPPYGISHNTNYTRFTGGLSDSRNFDKPIAGDDEPFDPSPFMRFKKVILWGANCFSDRLPMGTWLVWCKRRENQLGKFMSDCEVAWQKGGHGSYLFHHVWNGFDRESERGKTQHPTQKPVALMRWCIERLKLKPGATIFDPFMGSAPVAQAAIELGYRYIGIEKDAKHFATAVKRIESLNALAA
jgi:site-specific DNA-methyltransferase (adenine-specific)